MNDRDRSILQKIGGILRTGHTDPRGAWRYAGSVFQQPYLPKCLLHVHPADRRTRGETVRGSKAGKPRHPMAGDTGDAQCFRARLWNDHSGKYVGDASNRHSGIEKKNVRRCCVPAERPTGRNAENDGKPCPLRSKTAGKVCFLFGRRPPCRQFSSKNAANAATLSKARSASGRTAFPTAGAVCDQPA